MTDLPDGDTADGELGPYVVTTGSGRIKSIGFVVISLVAVAAIGAMGIFLGAVPIWGAVLVLTALAWSIANLIGRARTRWTFSADGIDYTETRLFGSMSRHIATDAIVAVGVETHRRPNMPNPFTLFTAFGALAIAQAEIDRKTVERTGGSASYRLAFRLSNGEVLRVDREQGRDGFVRTLQELARRVPRVTWPTMS